MNPIERNDIIDKRLDLFFFDPTRSHDDYNIEYTRLFPKDLPGYAPLYELRAQILDLRGKQQWLPAMLLADITVEGLVLNITAEDAGLRTKESDFEEFYETYFNFANDEGFLVRMYRNARTHNFAQFLGRVDNGHRSQKQFSDLKSKVENLTHQKIGSEVTVFKIYLMATTGLKGVAELLPDCEIKDSYAVLRVVINPERFLDAFEQAVAKLELDTRSDQRLRDNFENNLPPRNWYGVTYI